MPFANVLVGSYVVAYMFVLCYSRYSCCEILMADDNHLILQRGAVSHDVQPEQVNTDILWRLFRVSDKHSYFGGIGLFMHVA